MKRKQEFDQWVCDLDTFHMPRWDELSEVTLYMDQLIHVVEKHLDLFNVGESGKLAITPSMVNNYVKLGLMPKPIKKRYNRRHIAYLIIITLYKQVISIQEIRDGLRYLASSHGSSGAYDQFCQQIETSLNRAAQKYLNATVSEADDLKYHLDNNFDSYIVWTACETIINLFFSKKIISLIETEDQVNAASFDVPKTEGFNT